METKKITLLAASCWMLVIGLMLPMVGCKSQKLSVKAEVVTEVDAEIVKEEKRDSSMAVAVSENTVVETASTEAVKTTETVIEWSAPDETTGKQHPTKTIIRETESVKEDESTTNNIRDSTAEQESSVISSEETDYKSEQTENTESKTKTKVKTPAVLYWLIVGILVLIVLILKRYGLIKTPWW